MLRVAPLIATVALVGAACTSSSAEEPPATTSTAATVTTLPPTTATDPPTTTGASTTTTTTTAPPPDNECVVASVAAPEGYAQGCSVLGLTILAPEGTARAAVEQQADRIYHMLVSRPDLTAALLDASIAGRTIPAGTPITDLSEFADLYDQYPGTDWDRRGRSFPATELVPYFAAPEENLTCSEDDRNEGEDETIRSFALTIRRFALDTVDEGTARAIDQAYARAIAAGLWSNTLAEINADEYWMEGTQSFFDANIENLEEDRAPNSSHNEIDTREELRTYDPALWAIAESVYGDTEWRPTCP